MLPEVIALLAVLGMSKPLAANMGTGKLFGLDMTEEKVKKSAKLAKDYDYSNVEIRSGEMKELPFEDDSFDLIMSNCVINLSTDKSRTFKEIHRF